MISPSHTGGRPHADGDCIPIPASQPRARRDTASQPPGMTREGALLGLLRPLRGAVVYEAGAQIIIKEQGSFRHCHVDPSLG